MLHYDFQDGESMKVKKLFVCYAGILLGTVLANLYLNDLSFLFHQLAAQSGEGLLSLMIKRSIEIIFLVYIGMVINRKVWEYLIDCLSGIALGIVISVKTMVDGLFPTILYFFPAFIIVILYNLALRLSMTESQGKQESLNSKLHKSLFNKLIVVAIIFVNAFLEITIIKIF